MWQSSITLKLSLPAYNILIVFCHAFPVQPLTWITSGRIRAPPAPWRRLWSTCRLTSWKTWWRTTACRPIRCLPNTNRTTWRWSPWRAATRSSSWTGPGHSRTTWCRVTTFSPLLWIRFRHPRGCSMKEDRWAPLAEVAVWPRSRVVVVVVVGRETQALGRAVWSSDSWCLKQTRVSSVVCRLSSSSPFPLCSGSQSNVF